MTDTLQITTEATEVVLEKRERESAHLVIECGHQQVARQSKRDAMHSACWRHRAHARLVTDTLHHNHNRSNRTLSSTIERALTWPLKVTISRLQKAISQLETQKVVLEERSAHLVVEGDHQQFAGQSKRDAMRSTCRRHRAYAWFVTDTQVTESNRK